MRVGRAVGTSVAVGGFGSRGPSVKVAEGYAHGASVLVRVRVGVSVMVGKTVSVLLGEAEAVGANAVGAVLGIRKGI